VKKLFSILLALGLVLGMTLSAIPTTAQPAGDWSIVTVTVNATDCEGRLGTYYIDLDLNSTLTQGFHSVTVRFPEGTGYPAAWRGAPTHAVPHITIGGIPVFHAEITRDGDDVTFLVPETIPAGPVTIVFQSSLSTGIINPEAGEYHLYVKTSRDTMSTWVKSGWVPGVGYVPYEIKPTTSEYHWVLDFGDAYPGIAKDFIPPFKACGQDPGAAYNVASDNPFDSFADGDRWVTPFNLALLADPVGCQACPDMSAYLELTSAPAGGVARVYNATDEQLLHAFHALDPEWDLVWPPVEVLPVPGPDWDWDLGLHFSTVGTYTFDLVLLSFAGVCDLGCETVVRELEFVVHQQKDAFAIPLDEKWNLISLPLIPFDSDIDAMLASMATPLPRGILVSIWHYDAFDKEWLVYGGGQGSLTEIVDGKSYWFRLAYPIPATWPQPPYYWWVFGTEKPQPPAGPLEYPVAKGWNMAGFTSLLPMDIDEYLWNWNMAPYPVIYGWEQGAWTAQGWDLLDFSVDALEPGQGYWMAFPEGGYIYVPTP